MNMKRKDMNKVARFKSLVRRITITSAKTRTADTLKRAKRFRGFVSTIVPIYQESLTGSKAVLLIKCKQYPHLFSKTSFELMGRQALEKTHSVVITYLLKQPQIGNALLRALLQNVENKAKQTVIKELEKEDFETTSEYPVGRKTIDIFINGKGFVVVIENKFHAEKHFVDEGQSQTEYYKEKICEKFPNKEKIFLILDYKGTVESEGYHTLDYTDLDRALDTIKGQIPLAGHEQIITDYAYLIKRLIYDITNISANEITSVKSLVQLTSIRRETQKWNF